MPLSIQKILSGAEEDYDIPKESFGKTIFNCLRRRRREEVLNVDALTKEVLTCGKLLEHSIKLTQVFKNLGIEQGDAIAVVSENSIDYFIPVIAALYMGVIVNPLNPGYSVGELKHALIISKAKLIFCCESALKTILVLKQKLKFIEAVLLMGPVSGINSIITSFEALLETDPGDIDNYKPNEFNYREQVAFIFLSSGTTGLPKGVMLTHENLRASIGFFSHPSYGNITSEDTTVAVLPFYHVCGSILQILTMVTSMKSIVMNKFKPDVFLKSIQEYKVTKLVLVPPLILFLAKTSLVDKYDLSSLKFLLAGAAPLGKELLIEVAKRLGTVITQQLYGLTETCGPCTIQSDLNKIEGVGFLPPGGFGKVWDPDTKELVGPLETGEICLKGPMVMKGYIPVQNCIDDEGFLHTGDIGFYDQDGYLYVVGRLKELIKYKGFQVAPAELEALLITHDLVEDCGVIGIPDERAGELPLAFVVLKNGAKVTEKEIIDFVVERISVQKHLHGGVRFVKEIPKTFSGKILRRKLMEMFKNSD